MARPPVTTPDPAVEQFVRPIVDAVLAAIEKSPPPHRAYVDTRSAAIFLSCSPRTLEDMRLAGTGPPWQKFGRSVRYRLDDLIRFMERTRRYPGNESRPPRRDDGSGRDRS